MKKIKEQLSKIFRIGQPNNSEKLLQENFELQRALLEQTLANKVLVEILNRIDKKVLAKEGISIKVERPERTIN